LDVPKVVNEPLAVNKAPAVASPAAGNLTDKPAAPLVQPVNLTPKTPDKTEFFSSNALQEKAGGSKLMENITSQKAQLEKPKMADLLGKKSTILEKSIEQESQLKLTKKLRMMQSAALFAAVVAVAANGYFYYQLSPGADLLGFAKYNFDSNLRNDLFNLNQSLKSVQTDLNKYRYLTGQLYLNQFGYESTRFVDGIANLENPSQVAEKSEIQSIVAEAKNKMPSLLAGVKKNLAQSVTVDTYTTRGEETVDPTMIESEFQRELRLAISSEKKTLRDNSSQSNLEVPVSALAFFDNAAKLVGNAKLISNLNARTVDAFKTEADQYEQSNDAAQRAAFRGYIDNLLASTKVNLATISNLRNSRIKWSEVIDRIEKITLHKKDQTAAVTVPEDQLSLAIGKNGQNVRLASKLTGWEIDILKTGETSKSKAEAKEAAQAVEEVAPEAPESTEEAASTEVEPTAEATPAEAPVEITPEEVAAEPSTDETAAA
jgi:hypothetical protein